MILRTSLLKLSLNTLKRYSAAMASTFAGIEDVAIDNGRFKYVLIKLHSKEEGNSATKFIVRGFSWAEWHADIYDKTWPEIEKSHPSVECECVGGGRILHDSSAKSIKVYGYSQGYGLADHAESVRLLKIKYPDYNDITWSNEGY